MEGSIIARQDYILGRRPGGAAGFTLLELLVVVSVISLLMTILVPVLRKAQKQAQLLLKMNNQRQIVGAVNCFANDHDSEYPATTAKLFGGRGRWTWTEPRMIAGIQSESSEIRSLATHLMGYIDNAGIAYCPSAPGKLKYFQEAWDAGDYWDNPDTPDSLDALFGTYCFYWNFIGYLEESDSVFRGPIGPAGGAGQGSLLVSDYFGYDHLRSPRCFGSCEPFAGSLVTEGSDVSSPYWSRYDSGGGANPSSVEIELSAGYMDGHVSKYGSTDVVPMRPFIGPDSSDLHPMYGVFYLPRAGLE